MKNNVQVIGIDLGRGFTKAYSEYNNREIECLFKSVVGMGRNLDFSIYKEPIYIEVDSEDYFVGILAEKEGDTPTQNSKDSKISITAEKLLYAALNETAVADEVKLMIGVPNKHFKKSILNEITEKYRDKEIKIKDKINGGYKNIKILDVNMFREADAALLWSVKENKKNNKPVGMITVGFRTTEFSYFDEGLKFNDKKSKTMELGNRTALEYVQRILKDNNIMKELYEIDSSENYDDIKEKSYRNVAETIEQEVERRWINLDEMDIKLAGGTALKLKMDKMFTLVENPQMCTAKGLFLVGSRLFK